MFWFLNVYVKQTNKQTTTTTTTTKQVKPAIVTRDKEVLKIKFKTNPLAHWWNGC